MLKITLRDVGNIFMKKENCSQTVGGSKQKKKTLKRLIFQISFLLISVLAKGQICDTIPHWEGGLMIIAKTENERIDSLMKERGGILFRANYKIIDSLGVTIKESKFNELVDGQTMEVKKKDGELYVSQYILNNSTLTKEYYASGNLKFEHNNHFDEKFGFTETRTYYDNEFNSLEKMIIERRVIPEKFEEIKIEKWRIDEKYKMETLVVEQEVKDSIYVPIRFACFHPNGKIKEEGEYSQRRFFEFRNKDFYQEWLKDGEGYIDNYSVILNPRVKIKNGEWRYFDEEGNLIKKDFFDNGELMK